MPDSLYAPSDPTPTPDKWYQKIKNFGRKHQSNLFTCAQIMCDPLLSLLYPKLNLLSSITKSRTFVETTHLQLFLSCVETYMQPILCHSLTVFVDDHTYQQFELVLVLECCEGYSTEGVV